MVTILQSSDQSLISFAAPPGARSQRIDEGHGGNDLPPRHREHAITEKIGKLQIAYAEKPVRRDGRRQSQFRRRAVTTLFTAAERRRRDFPFLARRYRCGCDS